MKLSRSTILILDTALLLASFALISYSLFLVFLSVPNEQLMGPVQRIFYFHVGSATTCYISFGIVLIASLGFLGTRDWRYDAVAQSSGEVGFVFCTIVLITGMIWGHSAWNTWFQWEPRLITFLLLWLIFLSFIILRTFGEAEKVAPHSAVLGILGAVTVPIVVYSIKLLPSTLQLHPQVIENRGLNPVFLFPMFFTMFSLVVFQFTLLWLRVRVEILNRTLQERGM